MRSVLAVVPVLVFVLVAPISETGLIRAQVASPQAARSTQGPGPRTGAASTATASIQAEIAASQSDLAAAKADDDKYVSGLVKVLAEMRVAIISQTIAMLKQRQAAQDLNVSLKYSVDGHPFVVPPDAPAERAAVESEIEATKSQIKAQQAEADKYSGGLVLAMSLATVATSQQTLAMLEQKRVALKFGLPQFVAFAEQYSEGQRGVAQGPAAKPPTASVPPAAPQFEIVSIDSKVTETNDTWWRYAWKLVLKNTSAQAAVFTATIEFQDKDGFVIDQDMARDLMVGAGAESTYTGFALVRMPGASNVARTNAKVQRVR